MTSGCVRPPCTCTVYLYPVQLYATETHQAPVANVPRSPSLGVSVDMTILAFAHTTPLASWRHGGSALRVAARIAPSAALIGGVVGDVRETVRTVVPAVYAATFALPLVAVTGLRLSAKPSGNDAPAAAAKAAAAAAAQLAKIDLAQWLKLGLALGIDFAGDATLLLPGVGETADLAWAPLAYFALRAMGFGERLARCGALEEALPFTDVIPTATLAWLLETLYPESAAAKLLGLGPKEE